MAGTGALASCGCPSAWQLPNGTFYVVCQGRPDTDAFITSDSLNGPWRTVVPLPHGDGSDSSGGPTGKYEDPFLYTTKRGWHVLWHVYNTGEHAPHGHECADSTVSAHMFSTDGFEWHTSTVQPWGTIIARANGAAPVQVATRERPKLRFDEHGQMTHLLNGVCSASVV